jgi:hypothetical protein
MIFIRVFCLSILAALTAAAQVAIDVDELGTKLGGWTKRGKQAAEYALSGASYRTYKPEVSATPAGGLFVSLRIDHVRGWFSSDDHAVLEITITANGEIESAQSTLALQGRSITTDLIRSGTEAGQQLVGVDRAVKIGTDLVADLTSKMLREKIVEPGRVSYPAALRHNYNLLFQAIRVPKAAPTPAVPNATGGQPAADPTAPQDQPATPETPPPPPKPAPKLEIKGTLPAEKL